MRVVLVNGGVALLSSTLLVSAAMGAIRLLDYTQRVSSAATDAALVSEQINIVAGIAAQASAPGADLQSLRATGLRAGIKAQATMERLTRSGLERDEVNPLNRRLSEYYAGLALADRLFAQHNDVEARRAAAGTAGLVTPINALANTMVSDLRGQAKSASHQGRLAVLALLALAVGSLTAVTAVVGHRKRRAAVRTADRVARSESAVELAEVNRVLRTVTAADAVLVRASDEASLLAEMCQMIVDTGGYPTAWIATPDPSTPGQLVCGAGVVNCASIHSATAGAARDPILGHIAEAVWEGRPRVVRELVPGPEGLRGGVAVGPSSATLLALPLRSDGDIFGALVIGAHDPTSFDEGEVAMLEGLAGDVSFGISALRVRGQRLEHLQRVEHSFEGMVQAVATTVELRDPYTAGHQRTVAQLSAAIATELGLDADTIEGIQTAAGIHDIGKIAIPAEILSKPGKLTAIEFEIIKLHSQAGADILEGIDFPWPVTDMILQHHERMDGSGYPFGLPGPQILLGARIIAVADTVDAMSSHRPYRPSKGLQAALSQIEHDRDTLFDPDVVDACLRVLHSGVFRVGESGVLSGTR